MSDDNFAGLSAANVFAAIQDMSAAGAYFGAAAAANLLDDYEVGAFTPTFENASADLAVTYGSQVGKYTKIGNMVHCDIQLSITAKSAGTAGDALRVGGLPFAILSDMGGLVQYRTGFTTFWPDVLWGQAGTAYATMYQNTNGGDSDDILVSHLTNGSVSLWATLVYGV